MATISNVVRRGRIFHFRRAVPVELRQRLQRRELVRSLGNCDVKTARLFADQLYWVSEHIFEIARNSPLLTQDQLAQLAQSFYNHVLEREYAVRTNGAFFGEESRAARAVYWGTISERTRKTLGSNTLDTGQLTTQVAAKLAGLDWAAMSDKERHQCKEAIHRAGVDLAEALKARYEGDFNFEPKDKLLKRAIDEERRPVIHGPTTAGSPPLPQQRTISSTYRGFAEDQVRRGAWRQHTANQAEASYELSWRSPATGPSGTTRDPMLAISDERPSACPRITPGPPGSRA